MKKCKFCAEEIQDDAKKCRFCGEWIEKKAVIDTDELNTKSMSNNSFFSDWQEIISSSKEFKVKLPRDWKERSDAKETKKKTKTLSYIGFEDNKTQTYIVQRNDYSVLFLQNNIEVAENSMEKELLQARMNGFAKIFGGENIKCQHDKFRSLTAFRFSTENNAKKLTMYGLIFIKGPLIYSLIAYGKKLDENTLRSFFDSFQFLLETEYCKWKKCKFCAEEIQDDAKKCRFCGEWIEKNQGDNKIKKNEIVFLTEEEYLEKQENLEKNKTKETSLKTFFSGILSIIIFIFIIGVAKNLGLSFTVIVLLFGIVLWLGLFISKWYLKKKRRNTSLVKFIIWSNCVSWIIPVVGIFTGTMAIIFISRFKYRIPLYSWITNIGIALTIINSVIGAFYI